MSNSPNNVTPIRPRSKKEIYRGCDIVMTYNPETKRVDWTITRTRKVSVVGDNADFNRAANAARNKVNLLLDGD